MASVGMSESKKKPKLGGDHVKQFYSMAADMAKNTSVKSSKPAVHPLTGKARDEMSEDEQDEFDAFYADDETVRHPSHEDNADPVVMPNLVSKKPGALRTRGELLLHSRSAHRLFYGRRKDQKQGIAPVIGLVRFALNVNQIFELAAKDDPYADAALLDIEEKMQEAGRVLRNNIKALEELLSDMDGISIKYNGSVEPVVVPLEFKTTYGFLAAKLLNQYDKLVRLGQTAKHVGLFTEDDWARIVRHSGRVVRNVFQASTQYRFAGASRNDIAANNAAARAAIAKLGELPQSVLDGSKRGKYAPRIFKAGQAKV